VRHVLIACGIAMVLAGCGQGSEKLPAACTAGPAAIRKALASAPAAVRIDGTPISRCFNRDASGDDVQIIGTNLLAVATELGDRAHADSEGTAALQLGYLIGAARRGALRNGLGTELVRRLNQETDDLPLKSVAFQRGRQAGLDTG